MLKRRKRLRNEGERGAALVEFALALPILLVLMALVFDTGLGFTASRSSSAAARSAARVGALAGESRDADFRVLDAIRAQYGDGSNVQSIVIYKSDPAGDGTPSADCLAGGGTDCNFYSGSILDGLATSDFASTGTPPVCATGSIDSNWCPTDRRDDIGSYLGVAIVTNSDAAIGIIPGTSAFELKDRAVFALYFPPLPTGP